MYDSEFFEKLERLMGEISLPVTVYPSIKFLSKIKKELSSSLLKKTYDLHKEGYGIKGIGDYSLHVMTRLDGDAKERIERIEIVFFDSVKMRLFDLTNYNITYKGILLENPNSKESINVTLTNEKAYIKTEFVSAVVTPKGFYHLHRGIDAKCYGNIADDLSQKLVFSISDGIEYIRNQLALPNFNDMYSKAPHNLVELCFFGNSMENRTISPTDLNFSYHLNITMKKLQTLNIISSDIDVDGLIKKLDDKKINLLLKQKSKKLHTYNPKCYCNYCLSIHVIPMKRDNIIFDSLSRVVVTKKEFYKMLKNVQISKNDIEVIFDVINKVKNRSFESNVAFFYDDADSEYISDFIYENREDLVYELLDRYEEEIDEVKEMYDKMLQLKNDCKNEEADLFLVHKELDELTKKRRDFTLIMESYFSNDMSVTDFLFGITDITDITNIDGLSDLQDENDIIKYIMKIKDEYNKTESEYKMLIKKREKISKSLSEKKILYYEAERDVESQFAYSMYMYNTNNISISELIDRYYTEIGSIAVRWVKDEEFVSQEGSFDKILYSRIEDLIKHALHNAYNMYTYHIDVHQDKCKNINEKWFDVEEIKDYHFDNEIINTVYRRQNNEFDMRKIRDTITTIIGCGTLGSNIASVMARIGYRIFSFVDYDIVQYHNLPNQFFDSEDVTSYKVRALANNIYNILGSKLFPFCFTFSVSMAQYMSFDGVIPTLLKQKTDVVIMATDNLESRAEAFTMIQSHSDFDRKILVIDCRMNDLKKYVIYAYYSDDDESVEKHRRTIFDGDGNVIKLENDSNSTDIAVCGMQSSILVALQCSLKVIDILQKHQNNEDIPFFSTNEFDDINGVGV